MHLFFLVPPLLGLPSSSPDTLSPYAHQAVALTVAPTADGSQGWIFDERTFPLERGPWSCPEDYRSADHSECLEAVQQASSSWAVKGSLRVKGLKMVNSGERKRVPRGCSYSVEAEMAIYNKNPNGTSINGRMYQLACISLSHEALKAAHVEQADSTAAHKASKASKQAAHKANTASKKQAKAPPSDHPTGAHDHADDDHPEGGPCPGESEDAPHPDVGCHVPGPQPVCNEVHSDHPEHVPGLPDCDDMGADDIGGDPWFPRAPPSAASMNRDDR